MQIPIVNALDHYERVIEEDVPDPFHDKGKLEEYMARWDGPPFFEALGDLSGKSVLEIGVGTGRVARQVLDLGCAHLTGIDISPATVERAKSNLSDYRNVELIVADCNSFVRKESFDAAYSVLTFMHIEKKRRAISNIIASLKVGGSLVLSIDDCGKWFNYGIRKVRLYPASSEDYTGWLRESGCSVEPPVDLVDTFVSPKQETYGQRIATLIKATKQKGDDRQV